MQKEYWTETQWQFLKKCCNSNLRQFNIEILVGDDGIYNFNEVVFASIFQFECVIVAKRDGDSMVYEIPSEHFKENHHIMPIWVKYLMRVVYDNRSSAKWLRYHAVTVGGAGSSLS
jgi:hypothetical protein